MSLNHPNLKDHIFKYDLLPMWICDAAKHQVMEKDDWRTHLWYSNTNTRVDVDEQSELQWTLDEVAQSWIQPYIEDLFDVFHKEYHDSENTNSETFWEKNSQIKFNKYSVGDYLSPHHDHIRDLFQGDFRGIPVTSVVGVLNDDFEGGEFVFWREHKVKIEKGQVLAFPSSYLFPHEVTPVTSGVRYSWITWIV
tara:strand:- start:50 stop:631 length:582 start_codon:yes stop_codon:yes gene_type:complete